jgi:hypothetical protein
MVDLLRRDVVRQTLRHRLRELGDVHLDAELTHELLVAAGNLVELDRDGLSVTLDDVELHGYFSLDP